MEIHRIYIWICFFFCLAFASGGVLVFFRAKNFKGFPSFRFLQYALILLYTFGFYSLWSSVLFRILFITHPKYDNLSYLSGFLTIMGTPFLVAGMLMFILWSISLMDKKPGRFFLPLVLLVVILIVVSYLVYVKFDLLLNSYQMYALLTIAVNSFVVILISLSRIRCLEVKQKAIIILLILASAVIHIPLFFNWAVDPVFELLFIFFFFMTNTAIGVYFVYNVKYTLVVEEELVNIGSFDVLVKKYSLTARESEIILELYQGKTNQEIADKLFVTLQTIKDHTSRIYLKIGVKNRAQLTNLLRQFEQKSGIRIN